MLKEYCLHGDTESIRNIIRETNSELRRKGIGMDCDGVEIDSHQAAIDMLNLRHGTNYKKSDYGHAWAFVDFVEEIGVEKNSLQYAIDVFNSDKVLSDAKPEEGALILSKFFHEDEIDLHRITARPSYTESVTRFWYRETMPWVNSSLVHVQTHGAGISREFKVRMIRDLGLSYYFEDEIENAEKIIKETNASVIVVPQYWNEGYVPSDEKRIIIPRAYNNAPKLLRAYFALAEHINEN